jgi:D-inositol-3-phosphate glycosyltransferase
MKIAMVSVPATVHVAELSAALARRGHQVSLFTRRDDPDIVEKVEAADGYTVFHASAGPPEPVAGGELLAYMGPFARYLSAHWEVDRPDVTHGHTWMSGIATQLTARHLGLPAVQTFHGLGGVPREQSQLQAKVARAATWVTATCTDEVFQLTRMGISRSRTSVIPCGVDTGLFTPDGPQAPKCAENRIVAMGTLLPPRGFDTLVRALPMTLKTELVIVVHPESVDLASDPEVCRLRDLAAELGVSRRLHLYGSVARADMPALLRSADVVVCDPSYEPSGIGALEAMASGISVVASTVGCMRDIVVDDVTGRLVPPKDPVRMADAINSLLRDSFRRKSFGAAGRDRVRARYSWDRIVADTLRIYETLARPSDPRVMTPA